MEKCSWLLVTKTVFCHVDVNGKTVNNKDLSSCRESLDHVDFVNVALGGEKLLETLVVEFKGDK